MIRSLYRLPEETAKHLQLKQLCLDYFTHYEKLMKHPSKTHASRARKACILLKQVAHIRGLELLDLYAPSKNEGRPNKFPIKHWPKTLAKKKQKETNNGQIR
jgi:hypothetical protein